MRGFLANKNGSFGTSWALIGKSWNIRNVRSDSLERILACGFAVVIGIVAVTYCEAAPQPVSEQSANLTESLMLGEQQVFYTDMIEAYEADQLTQARQIARLHLASLRQRMVNPPHEIERASISHGTLGVLRSMLAFENKLPAGERLAAQAGLVGEIDELLLSVKGLLAGLANTRADMLAYLDGEMGIVAAEWIQAKQSLVTTGQLGETYETFRNELTRAGYGSLDDVLTLQAPAVSENARFLTVTPLEANQIEQTIHDYFQGLIDGDIEQIRETTGLDQQETTDLLESFAADLQQEGVRTIHAITFPLRSAEELRLQPQGEGSERVSTLIRGVEFDVTMTDDTNKTMIINKRVRLRPRQNGGWMVEPPND